LIDSHTCAAGVALWGMHMGITSVRATSRHPAGALFRGSTASPFHPG